MTAYRLSTLALVTVLLGQTVSAADASCDALCQHVNDHDLVSSIGSSIGSSASSSGDSGLVVGRPLEHGCGGYDASAIWKIWASALDAKYPSSVSHLHITGHADDRVCIDKAQLVKLTVAASNCHAHASGSSGGSVDFSSGSTGTINLGMDHHEYVSGGSQGSDDGKQDLVGHINTGSSGSSGSSGSTGNTGNVGGNVNTGNTGNSGSNINTGSSGSTSNTGFSSGSSSSSTGGEVTHSTSGWGHGNVNDESICFKIKDKRTERYLTSGGVEYAFAYYPNYYSVFRAYPSKSHAGSYTMTEINRSGSVVNYPVKLNPALGQFKPLYGDKDALFTFSPAAFGDSCWGVPGKKMSRRHDWGSWGDNYRQVSSGDDCADIELEEVDC